MDEEFKVIEFNSIDDPIKDEIIETNKKLEILRNSINDDHVELDDLRKRIEAMQKNSGFLIKGLHQNMILKK